MVTEPRRRLQTDEAFQKGRGAHTQALLVFLDRSEESVRSGTITVTQAGQADRQAVTECAVVLAIPQTQPINEDVTPVLLQTSYAVRTSLCHPCAHPAQPSPAHQPIFCGRRPRWPCVHTHRLTGIQV